MSEPWPELAALLEQWQRLQQTGFAPIWEEYRRWLGSQEAYLLGQQQVGQTPADEVARIGRARLIRYRPVTPTRRAIPLLIIPSLINRYFILDLLPERSLVAHLVGGGLDVFLLDWGDPTPADRAVTLDEHIVGYVGEAIARTGTAAGSAQVSLLGYCMGGMFAAVHAALFPERVATLVNLAGPIGYDDDGIFALLTRNDWFDADRLVDSYGNVPSSLLLTTFQMIRPTANYVRALFLYERLEDADYVRNFAAMQRWIFDQVDFPGEAFRRYIKALYQENQLVEGRFHVAGRCVDLGEIRLPLLTIASHQDETAPYPSVAVLHELAGSADRHLLEQHGPHVGMVAGRRAPRDLWPPLSRWLLARSGAQRSVRE